MFRSLVLVGIVVVSVSVSTAQEESSKISIVGEDGKNVLHTELVPYSKFERGESKWISLVFKMPIKVEKNFWVVLEFNAA